MSRYPIQPHRPTIYIIKPRGMDGPYKIGFTRQIDRRMSDIGRASPFALEIVASCAGDAETERRMHAYAMRLHSHFEWFHNGPEIHVLISAIHRGLTSLDWLPAPVLAHRQAKLKAAA